MYQTQSPRIIGVKCSPCRAEGQKSKLSYRQGELGAVKVKKKKNKKPRNGQACSMFSLSSLFLGKGEKKKTPSLKKFPFSFSLQQPDRFPPHSPPQGATSPSLKRLHGPPLLRVFVSWKDPIPSPLSWWGKARENCP